MPEYIKEGITLGGVTGTLKILDTSDANATPEDIIWGETAYVKGEKITGTKVVTVAQGKTSQKTFEENTNLIDDYGNRVKVPAGFKIAKDSATSLTGGVVIEDVTAGNSNTKGSQFVWIPVGDIITDNNGNKKTITLGRYTFGSNGNETLIQSAENCAGETQLRDESSESNYYKELLNTTSSANTKAKDILSFVKRALTNGGYYIARYEAGDAYATNSKRAGSDGISNSSNPVTCKAGVYPYTYINQPDSARLSRNMYTNSSIESDLINSYAWDTALVFIQTFSGDSDYSRQIGLSTTKTLSKVGESRLANVSNGDDTLDKRCNIYDLAGNTSEWTTETYSANGLPCVRRGGNFELDYTYTSFRNFNYSTTNSTYFSSFRVILYF